MKMKKKLYGVLGFSGGKDSVAAGLYLKSRGIAFDAIFSDTGNESEKTINYIDYINRNVFPVRTIKADFSEMIKRKREIVEQEWPGRGVPVEIIEKALSVLVVTGVPFVDLAVAKNRFPSAVTKFCTSELKVIPMMEQIVEPLLDDGYCVISYTGVRADESSKRRLAKRVNVEQRDASGNPLVIVCNPILRWSAEDTFKMASDHKVKPNPLYSEGCSRVGCFPCIHSRKNEIMNIFSRYPDDLKRIEEWGRLVALASPSSEATFFSSGTVPDKKIAHISDVFEWSKTARGGRQYGLIEHAELEGVPSCSSIYGLCE